MSNKNPHKIVVGWTETEGDKISVWLDDRMLPYNFKPSRGPDAVLSKRWLGRNAWALSRWERSWVGSRVWLPVVRWIRWVPWRLGFPRQKLTCHNCGRVSMSEWAHLTHTPCEGGPTVRGESETSSAVFTASILPKKVEGRE